MSVVQSQATRSETSSTAPPAPYGPVSSAHHGASTNVQRIRRGPRERWRTASRGARRGVAGGVLVAVLLGTGVGGFAVGRATAPVGSGGAVPDVVPGENTDLGGDGGPVGGLGRPLPDGALPDGALPDGALPDGAVPDGTDQGGDGSAVPTLYVVPTPPQAQRRVRVA